MRRLACALCLGLLAFGIYSSGFNRGGLDSAWTLATTLSLLDGKGGDLTDAHYPINAENRYALTETRGGTYSAFPIGTSLLVLPGVWLLTKIDPGLRNRIVALDDQWEQLFFASLICAAAIVLFFLVCTELQLGLVPASLACVLFAAGTSTWSVASGALWQHGPALFLSTLALLLLVRARQGKGSAMWAAIPLAFGYVCRPTMAIPAVFLTAYVALRHRRQLPAFLLAGVLVIAPWLAFNYFTYHSFLPPYFQAARISLHSSFAEALLGNLVSPARGLFVYSPFLLFSGPGFVCSARSSENRHLAWSVLAAVIAHWIAVSMFPHWWAGHCYGPRLMTETIPFLMVFVAFWIAKAVANPRPRAGTIATLMLLSAWSIYAHAAGATSVATLEWNVIPDNIDKNPGRLWNWRAPPFLAPWLNPHAEEMANLPRIERQPSAE